ncbi:MAG: DoxX family protein [Candidatus Hydrogenedentes bacterium]|nr:DoxX family protein [Candidatus Hydrogenedentota bacterium]
MSTLPQHRANAWGVLPRATLVVLRMAIGWHFLYEGLVKLADPQWTSAGYLLGSRWWLSDYFHQIAADPEMLRAVDLLNMWGLTLVGLGLICGGLTRLACLAGAVLLALYYIAQPPFLGAGGRLEGSYLFLDKNAIELMALLALMCLPTGRFAGVDGLIISRWKAWQSAPPTPDDSPGQVPVARRELLRHLVSLPVLGAFVYAFDKKRGWDSFEVKHLMQWQRATPVDALSGATLKTFRFAQLNELKGKVPHTFRFAQLNELKGKVPHAKIGNLDLSRVILGGNLIGGWAHARDLIYASSLVKAYHTDEKVFETFRLAEQCGINTILTSPLLCRVITDYWKKDGGKIQFISDCGGSNCLEAAQQSIDMGAHACYVQGATADNLVVKQDFDTIAKLLELTRRNGLPAGIGAHRLETVQACVEKGLTPDFWMKTLHHIDYWSAKPQPECDNIWCLDPEATIAYMEQLSEPWIAFKTLAAGAIHPAVAFPYAFKNGADFICVGMYDFQMVDNVNLFLDVWNNVGERKRVWRA